MTLAVEMSARHYLHETMPQRSVKRRRLSPPDEEPGRINQRPRVPADEIADASGDETHFHDEDGGVELGADSESGSDGSGVEDDEDEEVNMQEEDVDLEGQSEDEVEDVEEDAGSSADGEDEPQMTASTSNQTPQESSFKRHTAIGMTKAHGFRARTEALLKQISPSSEGREAAAESVLRSLKETIEGIPSHAPIPIQQAEKNLAKSRKVRIPFPTRPSRDAKYKLGFSRSSNINVVGSYALKTVTRSAGRLTLDMVVTMPEELLTEKDFLNHRYFHKRAYYLACIAGAIQAEHRDLQVQYQYFHDNELLPVAVVSPSLKDDSSAFAKSECDIVILIAAPGSLFPMQKTLPDRNCVRRGSEETEQTATPFYNASIRHDCSMTSYLKLLHGTTSKCQGFRHACLLGRVWLRQRGFASAVSQGGFGNFEWSAMLALLLQPDASSGKSVLLPTLDGLQLFRAALQFLARRDLTQQPLAVNSEHHIAKADSAILLDGSRGINVLFKMTPWSYRVLQSEARTSLKTLGSATQQQFDPTFALQTSESSMRYDMTVKLPLTATKASSAPGDYERAIYDLLQRGLGDRVSLVSISASITGPWPLGSDPRLGHAGRELTVSLSIDPTNASRIVDRGPSAEDTDQASQFNELWGDKAELRRFKDGSITYSAVWTATEPFAIVQEIITWLLALHMGIEPSATSFQALDASVILSADDQSFKTAAALIGSTYKDLENVVRPLQGLPLEIRHIAPASPLLSNSSLSAQMRSGLLYMPQPADVVVQFEGSTRWPTDLRAVQVTKAAFLLKLEGSLREALPKVKTQMVLENVEHETLNNVLLELLYPNGVKFHVRIHHEKEQDLIAQQLKDKLLSPRSREAAAAALSAYKRNFIQLPLHTQAMQKASTRHPALPGCVRLLKKWFSAHLLSAHFPPPAIELFAVHAFLHPQPWSVPATSSVAFLRSLVYLSRWKWADEPWIVDFGVGMTKADYEAIRVRFDAWRSVDPTMTRVAAVLATDADHDGSTWTEMRPGRVALNRLVALARAAVAHVRDAGADLGLASLYQSGLKDFDFTIHLAPAFTPSAAVEKKSKYKNLQTELTAGVDARQEGVEMVQGFVDEVDRVFGEAVLLFWDGTGARGVLGGLWHPRVTEGRKWRVGLEWSSVVEGEVARVNRDGVLAEIARLGGDMVHRIERKA